MLTLLQLAAAQTASEITKGVNAATTAQPNPAKFDQLATKFTADGGFVFEKTSFTTGMLGIVFAGFMLHIAVEFWKFEPRLNFKPHLIRWFVFSLLLLGYAPFAQTISGFVMSFGAVEPSKAVQGREVTKSFLAEQKFKFDEAQAQIQRDIDEANRLKKPQAPQNDGNIVERVAAASTAVGNELASNIVDGLDGVLSTLLFQLMRLVTEASFMFAAIALTFLKLLQGAMMKVLFSVGPIMIAFSSWPGVTSRYLSAWLAALIETSAWGLVAKAFIAFMVSNTATSGGDVADPNFFTYMGLNVLYAASLLSVPAITSSILRGSAGGGVTAAGMWGAGVSAAMSVGRMAASAARSSPRGASLPLPPAPPPPPPPPPGPEAAAESSAKPADKAGDRAFHAKRASIAKQQGGND